MLEEDKFIENVWNKYEMQVNRRKKEQFYTTSLYKNTDFTKTLRTAAMFVFTLAITVSIIGGVYAGVKKYSGVVQEEGTTYADFSLDGMEKVIYADEESVYYKVITSYETYLKYKNAETWDSEFEMLEQDFENYFLIAIGTRSTNAEGLYIENIAVDEENLYIELNQNRENKVNVVLTKIEKEKYRNNIVIKMQHELPEISYMSIEEIPMNYTIEQAVKDGYIVVKNNDIISDNPDAIKEFVIKSEKGENGFIRIVIYFEEAGKVLEFTIIDIEYKDGKYIAHANKSRGESENKKDDIYFVGNKFVISEYGSNDEEDHWYTYYITDEYGKQFGITSVDIK